MRGRKPLPAAIRELHGRAHRATKVKAVPVAPAPIVRDRADELAPPGWLSPRQAMLWIELVTDAPWLQPIDSALLGALVCARDIHRQAAEAVMQEGMVVTGISGREIPHPALKVTAQQAALVLPAERSPGHDA